MKSEFKIKINFLLINLILVNLSFGLINLVIFDTFFVLGWAYPSLQIFVNLSLCFSFITSKFYKINYSYTKKDIIKHTIEFYSLFVFLILIYWFLVNSSKYYKIQLILFFLLYFILCLICSWKFIIYLRKHIDIRKLKKILIIGSNYKSLQIKKYLDENLWYGYTVSEIINKNEFNYKLLLDNNYNEIYINSQVIPIDDTFIIELKKVSEEFLINIKIFNDLFSKSINKRILNYINNTPLIKLFYYPLDSYYNKLIKRIFDIFLSFFVIVFVFSWLFPLIALIIFIDNPGPIFFIQKRHGQLNKIFNCIKFRSLKVQIDDSFVQVQKNDTRVTRIGKIIRKTNIDELPQIINVLLGDMSIVGPRPHPIELNHTFSSQIDKFYFRHIYKPGITGLAQVKGYRGETDTLEKMQNRIKYDIYYIQNWSFYFDLKIIYMTLYNMIKGQKNAY